MAASPPPNSPTPARPLSGMRQPRSSSRQSNGSRPGESRSSDEDGKTSVKVAVRVRPPLKPDDPGFDLIPQRFQRSMVNVTSPTSLSVDSPLGRKLFVFDRVFGEDVLQDGVWDYVSESVSAFMQGYNVSVMAYGQSGAGKSYTMGTSGPAEQSDSQLMGVVPRAAAALFDKLTPAGPNRTSSGIKAPNRFSMSSVPTFAGTRNGAALDKPWQMKATYVEIYNEQLRDLLIPDSVPASERGPVTIREDTKGRILLTGLQQVNINSMEDLLTALNFGSSIRQTDATAINAKSSRSHAVFSLNLIQKKSKSAERSARDKRLSMPGDTLMGGDNFMTVDSKLHFVDLAGSERMKNTGAVGERAKEGISINGGLASLGKVIAQLSTRQPGTHVSYRDSKLTRLLQDSLGGNAITYMIACVNPAEFHISETLNTIQYAQRARAIQSKPKIQQVDNDGDKQALIDRLRAEVSFLRDQIRNSERTDRSTAAQQDRADKTNKEIELQNHLLDVQENYNALSQRHAKLIAEISKARDGSSEELPTLVGTVGESTAERIKRSTSFSEAVEQVVLEYEKTIQSLESSLSSTRSTLSTTESKLLERETKCAYVDTVNQQLQSRIGKLMERETNTEQYLHELEARLDGRTSGEERANTSLMELRKELARLRENESTSEEYISTLEERLAEADQDSELMQREISRLEHVVERQRSVGKLDNLLFELDNAQGMAPLTNGVSPDGVSMPNGIHKGAPTADRKRAISDATYRVAIQTPLPEINEDDFEEDASKVRPSTPEQNETVSYPQTPAQTKFVEEKLENVNQELFDLRVEHESTVHDYNLLSAKYEEALRTLAALEQSLSEQDPPQSPTAFLSMARVKELKKTGQPSSSRSLSSELSSAGESLKPSEISEDPTSPSTATMPGTLRDEDLSHDPDPDDEAAPNDRRISAEIEGLRLLCDEKDQALGALIREHEDLTEKHQDTLDMVEELKADVQKAKMYSPPSPTTQFLRRKSSQNFMSVDRVHRSLSALDTLTSEGLEENQELKESFELHIGAVRHELYQRTERVQILENELAGVKKEMESKMTIISGLTRERSSLKQSSPVDMSMFTSMRDQILQHESQLKSIKDMSAAREAELNREIDTLRGTLSSRPSSSSDSKEIDMSGNSGVRSIGDSSDRAELSAKVTQLQNELTSWESKHREALDSMKASEGRLKSTISDLEITLSEVEEMRKTKSAELEDQSNSMAAAAAAFDLERHKNLQHVEYLTRELTEHKSAVQQHASRVAELEAAQAASQEELQKSSLFKEETQKHLDNHREQISSLEEQLKDHEAAVETHKEGLKSLQDSHVAELEKVRAEAQEHAEKDAEARIIELSAQHEEEMEELHKRSQDLEKSLQEQKAALQEHKRQVDENGVLIARLEEEKSAHSRTASSASGELTQAQTRLRSLEEEQSSAKHALEEARKQLEELESTKSTLHDELNTVKEREQRASRLVEELEGELQSSFERSQQATSRLSLMQNSKDQELSDARAETVKAQEEITTLKNRLEQLERRGSVAQGSIDAGERSNSLTGGVRKTSSVTTLPSPPPAIPLPPLPTGSPPPPMSPQKDIVKEAMEKRAEEQENRIRTIEKHLFAEKQLTATLEEALVDLETQGKKIKIEVENWKKKAWEYEDELTALRKERNANRSSLQAVEEERNARKEAEAARAQLEERMAALNKKKKKSTLNCF